MISIAFCCTDEFKIPDLNSTTTNPTVTSSVDVLRSTFTFVAAVSFALLQNLLYAVFVVVALDCPRY